MSTYIGIVHESMSLELTSTYFTIITMKMGRVPFPVGMIHSIVHKVNTVHKVHKEQEVHKVQKEN
jgi:hypothetical protein